jgi:hypothetical protein
MENLRPLNHYNQFEDLVHNLLVLQSWLLMHLLSRHQARVVSEQCDIGKWAATTWRLVTAATALASLPTTNDDNQYRRRIGDCTRLDR